LLTNHCGCNQPGATAAATAALPKQHSGPTNCTTRPQILTSDSIRLRLLLFRLAANSCITSCNGDGSSGTALPVAAADNEEISPLQPETATLPAVLLLELTVIRAVVVGADTAIKMILQPLWGRGVLHRPSSPAG